MNVNFNLKKTGDYALIVLIFNFGYYETSNLGTKIYKFFKLSTGEKIKIINWDYKQQRCRIIKGFPDAYEINFRLENLKNKVINVYRKLLNDGKIVTPDLLRKELSSSVKVGVKVGVKVLYFVEYSQRFHDTCKRSNETKKKYQTLINKLKEYEQSTLRKLRFEDINLDFYNTFTDWLKLKKYSINTISGYIKNLKVFMEASFEEKLHTNIEYRNKKFKIITEDTDSIYLTETEIKMIYECELNENLSKWRDMFVISCYTALRFSDFSTLKKEHFSESYLTKRTIKTGEKVVIPLHPIVKEILLKYNYNLPKLCSNQKFNEHLKTIGLKAEIKSNVIVNRTEGYDKKVITFKKYELITSHTGRRSAATNMILAGIPHQAVMKFTGHRTYKSFIRYLKMSSEENAELLKEHSFFK